jgi:hypothetical protein
MFSTGGFGAPARASGDVFVCFCPPHKPTTSAMNQVNRLKRKSHRPCGEDAGRAKCARTRVLSVIAQTRAIATDPSAPEPSAPFRAALEPAVPPKAAAPREARAAAKNSGSDDVMGSSDSNQASEVSESSAEREEARADSSTEATEITLGSTDTTSGSDSDDEDNTNQ